MTDNGKAIGPCGLQRITVVIGVITITFLDGLILHKIIKMQAKDNSMIMRTMGRTAILTAGEKPDLIIRETLAKTLHPELKISFT